MLQITFEFTSSVQVSQESFQNTMANLLGISVDLIEIVSFKIVGTKRASFTVEAVFLILGDSGGDKAAELQQKVLENDSALSDAGFSNASASVEMSSVTLTGDQTTGATGSSSTTGNDEMEVSESSVISVSSFILLLALLLCM
jgi:hypothetical protein